MYLKHVCLYKRRSNIRNSKRRLTLNRFDAILKCNALILKMARLRFPGRPGQRIGKNYVKYVYDDVKMNMDACLSAHSKIEIGLKIFYELFGYSDEVRVLITLLFFLFTCFNCATSVDISGCEYHIENFLPLYT